MQKIRITDDYIGLRHFDITRDCTDLTIPTKKEDLFYILPFEIKILFTTDVINRLIDFDFDRKKIYYYKKITTEENLDEFIRSTDSRLLWDMSRVKTSKEVLQIIGSGLKMDINNVPVIDLFDEWIGELSFSGEIMKIGNVWFYCSDG